MLVYFQSGTIPNRERIIKPKEIKKRILNGLREKGFKLTPQRLEIIDIVSRDRSHPTAQSIFQKARKRAPRISMSTVYYTLNMLKKEGLIKELEFYEMDNRYESNIIDHLDLVCLKCGRIQDFTSGFPVSLKKVEGETGFQANNMRFEYYGYCKGCRRG
jgi:Fe2+ or Zn2+ uptake regulation protein